DSALPAGTVGGLLLVLLHEHEAAEDVEQAVALQHLFPQIAGAIARGVRRVAGAAFDRAGMAAAVERQEMRRRSREPGRPMGFVRIGGKMHERAALETRTAARAD